MTDPIAIESIQNALIEIRGQQVLLDSDVARIYGVETKRINEAVRNNPDKFPQGYILSLSKDEWDTLKSKISSSSWGGKNKIPKAFTERGLYMLATILKSKQATEATLNIIETFAKLRDLGATMNALSTTKDKPTQKPRLSSTLPSSNSATPSNASADPRPLHSPQKSQKAQNRRPPDGRARSLAPRFIAGDSGPTPPAILIFLPRSLAV